MLPARTVGAFVILISDLAHNMSGDNDPVPAVGLSTEFLSRYVKTSAVNRKFETRE